MLWKDYEYQVIPEQEKNVLEVNRFCFLMFDL